jgi:hypothetical protein
MPPPTRTERARASLIALLESEGADRDPAQRIVDELLSCGLTPAQARVWLSNGNRCYPITVPGWAWQQVPTHAIEDGCADLVLDQARRFAAASEDERAISVALCCDLDDVSRLTGQDPQRAATIRAILALLRKRLGTDTRAYDVTFSHMDSHGSRMIDLMLQGAEGSLLERLEANEVDLQNLLANGLLEVGF